MKTTTTGTGTNRPIGACACTRPGVAIKRGEAVCAKCLELEHGYGTAKRQRSSGLDERHVGSGVGTVQLDWDAKRGEEGPIAGIGDSLRALERRLATL